MTTTLPPLRHLGVSLFLASSLTLGLAGCFEEPPDPGVEETGTDSGSGDGDGDSSGDGDGDGSGDGDGDGDGDTGGAACEAMELCVAEAPAGWTGPVAFAEGPDLADLPNCSAPFGGLSIEVSDDPVADPASCGACSCGGAEGIDCSSPKVRFYNNSGCAQNGGVVASEFQLGPVDACTVFPNGAGAYGAESDTVDMIPGTGACAPAGGEPTVPAFDWGSQLRACAPSALDSCGGGRVCAPTPGAPFASNLCIHRPGDIACPAGDYSERFVRYLSVTDDRGCSACECGDPEGGDCDAEILFSNTNTCTEDYLTLTGPGSGGCTTLWGSTPSSGKLLVNGVDGATCASTGGEAIGSVAPDQAVTFCCAS